MRPTRRRTLPNPPRASQPRFPSTAAASDPATKAPPSTSPADSSDGVSRRRPRANTWPGTQFSDYALLHFHQLSVPATSGPLSSPEGSFWIRPEPGSSVATTSQVGNALNFRFARPPRRFKVIQLGPDLFSARAANNNLASFIASRGRCKVGSVSLLLFPTLTAAMAGGGVLGARECDVSTPVQTSNGQATVRPPPRAPGPAPSCPTRASALGIHSASTTLSGEPSVATAASAPYLQEIGKSHSGVESSLYPADPRSAAHSTPGHARSPRAPNGCPASSAPNGCQLDQVCAATAITGDSAPLSHPLAARPYLMALLAPASVPLKTPSGTRLRRARSLPALHQQCFRCLATDHLVDDCRDPVRCRQCLRYGHRRASCSMASPASL